MARKTPKMPGRHVATIREGLLVSGVYDALRTAVLDVLDNDEPLAVSTTGARSAAAERTAQAQCLSDQAERAVDAAAKARLAATGYEDAAMEARAAGDKAEQVRLMARVRDKRDEADARDTEAEHLRAEATDLIKNEPAEVSITTLAHLLELLRRSAEQLDGFVPAVVAPMLRKCFTDWQVDVGDGIACTWRCTARLTLVDGRTVALPLTGSVANTAYGRGSKDPYTHLLVSRLSAGATLDELAEEGVATRRTSRESLYIKATQFLVKQGVSAEVAGPLLDHPHQALQVVLSGITDERPDGYTWGRAFERHMATIYSAPDARWASAASPTKHSRSILAVFAVIQQHPNGVLISDVANAAGVSAAFVKRLVSPHAASNSRSWPKMLEWVEGRVGHVVRAIACPHKDCRGVAVRATVPVFLPETAPDERGVGGVLCPSCSRLPRADYAAVVFPSEWHRPICSASPDGRHAARQGRVTYVVAMPSVPAVTAAPVIVRLPQLVAEFGVPRAKVREILDAAGVELEVGRGRGGRELLYTATARDVIAAWVIRSDPETTGKAVRIRTLAVEFGIQGSRVREVLNEAGVARLPQRGRGLGGAALYPAKEARKALAERRRPVPVKA